MRLTNLALALSVLTLSLISDTSEARANDTLNKLYCGHAARSLYVCLTQTQGAHPRHYVQMTINSDESTYYQVQEDPSSVTQSWVGYGVKESANGSLLESKARLTIVKRLTPKSRIQAELSLSDDEEGSSPLLFEMSQ